MSALWEQRSVRKAVASAVLELTVVISFLILAPDVPWQIWVALLGTLFAGGNLALAALWFNEREKARGAA